MEHTKSHTYELFLSIIIPLYNVQNFVANCIESLLKQDLNAKEYEILIINDGSTDESGTIAENYAKEHDNIHVFHQENKGVSISRNKGISLAQGKYLYFMDADDYIAKNTLGYIKSILNQHNLDILCAQGMETEDLTNYKSRNLDTLMTEQILIQDGIAYIATHNYLNTVWHYFINKKFLDISALSFPEGRLVEDANFTAELFSHATRIADTDLDFYRYVIHQKSIMRTTTNKHLLKLINDYEENIRQFQVQIDRIKTIDHPQKRECIKRLKTRQQSFVFFMLIRCIRAKFSFEEMMSVIKRLETSGDYPIKTFIGEDYNKMSYKMLVPILNNKNLLRIFLFLYSSVKK